MNRFIPKQSPKLYKNINCLNKNIIYTVFHQYTYYYYIFFNSDVYMFIIHFTQIELLK